MKRDQGMTADEAIRMVQDFNERMRPSEEAFVAFVEANRNIGYGRMIQLIGQQWEKLHPGVCKNRSVL